MMIPFQWPAGDGYASHSETMDPLFQEKERIVS
ncbi:hypothetical protein BAAM0499_03450 [Bifidobacterium animalis subsp. animalis MCC 0499]|nr:hypothetical protein BAAM0499_03450 [Bifidobacterium animalis subsp. animalis MCC 0499]